MMAHSYSRLFGIACVLCALAPTSAVAGLVNTLYCGQANQFDASYCQETFTQSGGTFTAEAWAAPGYETLGTRARVTLDHWAVGTGTSDTPVYAMGRAGFDDQISISGSPDIAKAQFVYDVSGSISDTISFDTTATNADGCTRASCTYVFVAMNGTVGGASVYQELSAGSYALNVFSVEPDVAFDVSLYLTASVLFPDWYTGTFTGTGTLDVDFLNTATLREIRVFDGNGTLIDSGLRVSSASGTDYTLAGAPPPPTGVPEPSTLALLGIGIVFFGVRWVRRSR